ncbi:MAG: hypothetical protein LBK83_05470 [Treponema sp.]|jgi:2,4-dienoyl-CoA reductase-like NADH-dependent reductase (Old Yellow Enzyme family)|nr:hypothetical protein [Treponema sp.]
MKQYDFSYKTLEDIRERLKDLTICLPLSEETDILFKPLMLNKRLLQNRIGIAPMEGFDACPDGTPSELTRRRYLRYARGGAALIWFESVTIVPEGRSSPRQLVLTKETLPQFQRFVEEIKETGLKENGYAPFLVMQANHSGRYSHPNPQTPQPIAAFHNPVIEGDRPLDSSCIASDDYLASLEDKFGESAKLCRKAGFDGIDIKSCHGYLLGELAGAFNRPGIYGGNFENRFRLLFNSLRHAQCVQSDSFMITVRLNIFDGFPYPYGYGVVRDGSLNTDYSEPLEAVRILHRELGVSFINITMGDPHIRPYITRPFLRDDKFLQMEDPLAGLARMYNGSAVIKRNFPELVVSASAPSYLHQFAPNLAAGAIQAGACDQVCFGRLAFANPCFPRDIKESGFLEPEKACIACSKCSSLGRGGMPAGCIVRDAEVYLPYYKSLMDKNKQRKQT